MGHLHNKFLKFSLIALPDIRENEKLFDRAKMKIYYANDPLESKVI